MSGSGYDSKDNTEEVLKKMEAAIERGLRAIGMTAEGHAKDKITEAGAVDTGRLRNSITFAISGESANISSYSGDNGEEGGTYQGNAPDEKKKAVYIGTNVEYAEGIETGTHRRAGAVHFLQDAATGHATEYKKLMKGSMENA